MSYVLLLLATLSWSFVGILVKLASSVADSWLITFARFFLGVVFLGVYLLLRDRKLSLRAALPWIWIGAIGKSLNYLFENIAIAIGYAYADILVQPAQTITLLLAARFMLGERITPRGWIASALCVTGVLIVGWNGMPIGLLLGGGALTTLLFTLAGIGAAVHILSQRVLVRTMDAGNLNFSVFLWSAALCALPLPFQSEGITGEWTAAAWIALLLLGVITGLSFLWFAEAMKKVPFAIVAIVGNCSVLFTILWAYLFFREPITWIVILGTIVFVAGFLLLNFSVPRREAKRESGELTA
ncbi:DMT family transporter [Paenibacillus xanthanilyticus]|uniref:DMT family transporter n=1 Tax=Paenibacillus xanthanilyticus TaxID=1783531 RepID=A0ABV8JVK1_9BACL